MESKTSLLLSDAGNREPPRAPPRHPGPGGIRLAAPYLPASPRSVPLSVGGLLAALLPGRLLRKNSLLFFKLLSNYSAKCEGFFPFCLPRCAFAFTLPESLFSSLPLAQTWLEHFGGGLPMIFCFVGLVLIWEEVFWWLTQSGPRLYCAPQGCTAWAEARGRWEPLQCLPAPPARPLPNASHSSAVFFFISQGHRLRLKDLT